MFYVFLAYNLCYISYHLFRKTLTQIHHDLIEKSENMFLNERTSMRPTRTLLSEKKLIYKKEVPKGFR